WEVLLRQRCSAWHDSCNAAGDAGRRQRGQTRHAGRSQLTASRRGVPPGIPRRTLKLEPRTLNLEEYNRRHTMKRSRWPSAQFAVFLWLLLAMAPRCRAANADAAVA